MQGKIAIMVTFTAWSAAAPHAFAAGNQFGSGAEQLALECFDPDDTSPQHILMACNKVLEDTNLTNEPFVYGTMGVAYLRLGQYGQAVAEFNSAISLAGKDFKYLPDYYRYRCLANLNYGKPQDALGDCTASLSLQPNNVHTLDFRGDVEYRLRDYKSAIADFDAVLSQDAKQAGSQYVRGLARIRNGDASGGQADIVAAQAVDPNITQEYIGFDKQS